MSVFQEQPKAVKSNGGTRTTKNVMKPLGLAYITNLIRKGEELGIDKPGVVLDKFVEVTGIKPTQKQRETLSNFTHKLNQSLPGQHGIRIFYGVIGKDKAIYFRWVNRKDGKKNRYEISKAEIQKYYAWLDEYIPKFEEVQEAQETLDNEREKKKPNKKTIEEAQAIIFGAELPEPPAVTVEVIKA